MQPGAPVRRDAFAPLVVPAILALCWESAVRWGFVDGLFFPAPSTLAKTFGEMIRDGELARNIGRTLARALAGFSAGAVAGIICGAAMGISRWARWALEPVTAAMNSMPKLTLFPMLMLLVGTGEPARQILLAATAFVIVTLNTLDGVSGISGHFKEMAVNCGASRSLLWRRVYLPASAPQIFSGLRLAMGRVLVLSITVEMLGGAGSGLGNLVWTSWQTFAIERLYVAVALSALLGLAIHRVLSYLETRLIPWRVK